MGWIAVDLDGTLAHYDGWIGIHHIGEPVPKMMARVKKWIEEGKEVRIFTARVWPGREDGNLEEARNFIRQWCVTHIGKELPITHEKDFGMLELWDDRCIQVNINTGERADGKDSQN